MNKIEQFVEHLKLDLNYSEQTIKSYVQDIESFDEYLRSLGHSFKDANPQLIRMYLSPSNSALLPEGSYSHCRQIPCC